MNLSNPSQVCSRLIENFREAAVYRPMRISRYEAGTELVYDVTGMVEDHKAQVRLTVERFVGGGFAGQVYRVRVADIRPESVTPQGLKEGETCAMKILIPPTAFSRFFRNVLYLVGFQGPFQLQVNPAAARAGALWQKFIRRGAKVRFGDERSVVDIYGTFVDERLGSCGELSEWIDGRTWRLEADDRVDLLGKWKRGKPVQLEKLGSPEYRAKREFMAQLVKLLHDMGCHEFARQYEWSTCKSQPNCLKRADTEGSPPEGLVAVDFRAGLVLLPFLPMSPGDFKLIVQGLGRGSLIQFDRGDLSKLEQFTKAHREEFRDTDQMLEELKTLERTYRDSLPDITHNRLRLLYDKTLWQTIFQSALTGWKVRNLVDQGSYQKLRKSKAMVILFFLLGMIPLLGKFFRRIWGREDWRRHYRGIWTSWTYLGKAVRARASEKIIDWHRSGRVHDDRALNLARHPVRFFCHWPFSLLPSALHRFLTDWPYAKGRLDHLVARPFRLYFDARLREQWLREMVEDGRKNHLLTDDDARVILSQVGEPFIQKYLKSLAVHLCTLPVTQVVSVFIAILYIVTHPELPRAQAWTIGLGIIALFQVLPISPGSLVRGLYVVYLVLRERNFKDYNIALFLGFFKYIGYLAFPIQMTYRYPALARFMAGHWATEAVHIVPVFGERGALLEHGVFCLFYNWPLTIRRRIKVRGTMRASIKRRYWHIPLCALAGSGILGLFDFLFLRQSGVLPELRQIWWLAMAVPLLCGAVVTLGAGGAGLGRRIIGAALCGALLGALHTALSATMSHGGAPDMDWIALAAIWRMFLFTIFSAVGAVLTELKLPEPGLK